MNYFIRFHISNVFSINLNKSVITITKKQNRIIPPHYFTRSIRTSTSASLTLNRPSFAATLSSYIPLMIVTPFSQPKLKPRRLFHFLGNSTVIVCFGTGREKQFNAAIITHVVRKYARSVLPCRNFRRSRPNYLRSLRPKRLLSTSTDRPFWILPKAPATSDSD